MSLEEQRALPWYEADSIMGQLIALEGEGKAEETNEVEGTGENLAGLGFTYTKD